MPSSKSDPITHYIIVRRDLPTGTICAMIAHAAGESYQEMAPELTTVVILAAKGRDHLWDLSDKLRENNIPFRQIFESDPPYNGALMALGLYPGRKSKLYPYTHGYNLMRFE